MTVFVDDYRQFAAVGRVRARWSHLFAGPFDDLAELHALAVHIGMSRSWFQGPPEHPWPRSHYDVTDSKRRAAIAAGAVPITWREAGQQIIDARKRARCRCGAAMPADEHGQMVHPEPWCQFMARGAELPAEPLTVPPGVIACTRGGKPVTQQDLDMLAEVRDMLAERARARRENGSYHF